MEQLQLQTAGAGNTGSLEHDHRWLAGVITATCTGLRESEVQPSVSDALGILYVRICAHFALEEKLLRDRGPEVYAAHKARDEALLDRMRIMMDAYDDGACNGCEKSLEECLGAWLREHVGDEHSRLHPLHS